MLTHGCRGCREIDRTRAAQEQARMSSDISRPKGLSNRVVMEICPSQVDRCCRTRQGICL